MLDDAGTPGGLPESVTRPALRSGALAGGLDAAAADDVGRGLTREATHEPVGAIRRDASDAKHGLAGVEQHGEPEAADQRRGAEPHGAPSLTADAGKRGDTASDSVPGGFGALWPLFAGRGSDSQDAEHATTVPAGSGAVRAAESSAPAHPAASADALPSVLGPPSSDRTGRQAAPGRSRRPRTERRDRKRPKALPEPAGIPESTDSGARWSDGSGLRVVGYTRVSTDGQAADGVSLEAQRQRITAWAEANAGMLAACYTDAGVSGKRADIPYGWDLAPDGIQLIENPAEQFVLSRIRAWRATGHTLREIADRLSVEGVPTKKGRARWTHQSVGRIAKKVNERSLSQL